MREHVDVMRCPVVAGAAVVRPPFPHPTTPGVSALRTLAEIRAGLARELPLFLDAALDRYRETAAGAAVGGEGGDGSPKAVAAQAAACRAALGHVEALLRLARWAVGTAGPGEGAAASDPGAGPGPDAEPQDGAVSDPARLAALIAAAEAEVAARRRDG